jgi:hypothetical protein
MLFLVEILDVALEDVDYVDHFVKLMTREIEVQLRKARLFKLLEQRFQCGVLSLQVIVCKSHVL